MLPIRKFCGCIFLAITTTSLAGVGIACAAADGLVDLGRQLVAQRYSLPALNLQIDVAELAAQECTAGQSIAFLAALNQALTVILTGDDDDESPLALAYELSCASFVREWQRPCYVNGSPARGLREVGEVLLRNFLNRPSTKLTLLARGERAEYGEDPAVHWIFQLHIPNLSDHVHWAVVDRSGQVRPYVYGFN